MTVIKSKLDTSSKIYNQNVTAMNKRINELNLQVERIQQGGSDQAKARQTDAGKLLVRERIKLLIDPDTTFLELSLMAGFQLYDENLPAGGIITGIGQVNGIWCMIMANDPSVKGGTYFPITIKKQLRAQEIAANNQLPCLYLVDSGGIFLPKQEEVFADKDHFGRIFYNEAQMSARNIPQIAIVMGLCIAGGAYVPSMADIVIMVKEQATIYLAGPELVKAATGEKVTSEELGGADLHCRQSGVADYIADNDEDAIRLGRLSVANLNRPTPHLAVNKATPPATPKENLLGLVHDDPRMPIEMKEIIAAIVDGSIFDEFKANYGSTLICGFAHIEGHAVGIVANNGVLFSESALKGTHFIQLCNKRKIPLIFLQNITGFMVGQNSEAAGIAKHGAKMVNAVACSTVPKITVIVGGSYGAGNYAMCGRAYEPDFLFMWPNAHISVMGGAQAATVLSEIKHKQSQKQSANWDKGATEKYKSMIQAQYEHRSNASYASARLWDDGIINPLDTRKILGFTVALAMQNRHIEDTQYGVFRM